jgi:hypothetical protein
MIESRVEKCDELRCGVSGVSFRAINKRRVKSDGPCERVLTLSSTHVGVLSHAGLHGKVSLVLLFLESTNTTNMNHEKHLEFRQPIA